MTVINGHTLSAQSNGNVVVIDGSTIPVAIVALPTLAEVVLSVDGNIFTAVYDADSIILRDEASTITISDGGQASFELTLLVHYLKEMGSW